MPKGAKNRLIRIGIAVLLFLAGIVVTIIKPIPKIPIETFIYIIAYFAVGYDVIISAAKALRKKEPLDENFLMSIASIGALYTGEYIEAVAIMTLYQLGETCSDIAVFRAHRSVNALMDLRPEFANLIVGEEIKRVEPESVKIGDTILVRPSERIPLDGNVVEGGSAIDVSAVLGESIPREAAEGDSVLAGSIAQNGTLKIKVTSKYTETAVAKIINLGKQAAEKKAKSESFVTRFARVYTPIVVLLALAITIIPPFLGGEFSVWFHRALMFLVVSCPCGLVISVPLSYFCSMGAASKKGILIKGGNALENLSKVDMVCFDKTGTLTDGSFSLKEVVTEMDKTEFLNLVSAIESRSTHPIAKALSLRGNRENFLIGEHKNFAGKGVSTEVNGKVYYAGTARFMSELNIDAEQTSFDRVYVSDENKVLGYIVIGDRLKLSALNGLKRLKLLGIKNTALLTGATLNEAENTAKILNLSEVYASLLPEDKLEIVKKLKKSHRLMYVGDGINDVPVLAEADVGVSMGVSGSDAAIEASDTVIMDDNLERLGLAIKIGRRTERTVKFNIAFSLIVKALVLVFSALGITNMWFAVFADVGVLLIAVLNSTLLSRLSN